MILWYSGCGNSRFVADTLVKTGTTIENLMPL